jgi:type I restriction enzyme S subunit
LRRVFESERAAGYTPLNYGKALTDRTRRPGNVPVFGTNGQCGWHDQALVPGPGVILGRKGMGNLGVEWYGGDFWVIDTAYFVKTLCHELDLKFFYYLAKYIGLNHLKDGTSNPSLSRDTFYAQLLPHPSLSDQKAIVDLLGSLDQKIDLNRRMNETLEAIARSIFRSWFVDFDPVRAKMDGRPPHGLDAETAGLFPDSFGDSLLGPIPTGWRVSRLEEICQFNRRQIRGAPGFELIDYIDISSVMRGRLLGSQRIRFVEAPSRARRLVAKGDTIFSTVRPGRGAFLYIADPSPELVVSTGFVVMSPVGVTSLYLHKWVTTDEFIDFMDRNADGAAYPAISPERIGEGLILVPPRPLLDRFEAACQPCFAKITLNERESLTLAALRDALLPKLLSGEIRVKETAALAESNP